MPAPVRLNLTRAADHALRAMVWLASRTPGTRHKAAAIATGAVIPPSFAARVLAQLHRSGLLSARAGQDGGYSLSRAASAVTLLEVIEAVEGPLRATHCLLRDHDCGLDGYCALHGPWSEAQEGLRRALSETPLHEEAPTPQSVT